MRETELSGQRREAPSTPVRPGEPDSAIRARISRAAGRAGAAILWERLWPRLAPLVGLLALYLILSWFGLWRLLPDWTRYGVLAGFALAGLAGLVYAVRIRLPEHGEALARVERASGLVHRPATAFGDRLEAGADDPAARALWAAHRTRLLGRLKRLRGGIPAPGIARRDPYAVRFLLALVLVVAFFYAGPDRFGRLTEALKPGVDAEIIAGRIDAWATPPAYTSRPPIFLTGPIARPAGSTLSVPVGTVVTIRVTGQDDLRVLARNAGETREIAPNTAGSATAPREFRAELGTDGSVEIASGGTAITGWRFTVEPDRLPEIALVGEPGTALSGALSLAYTVKDDYGIVAAEARIEPVGEIGSGPDARPLVEAPKFPLSLPQRRMRDGKGETIRDLTAHPWAGSRVRLILTARDEAGQVGESQPIEFTLPSRRFFEPLSRALVEQRRNLALDANQAPRVAGALDALTLYPEMLSGETGTYLGIRAAFLRTARAADDDALRDVLALLWDIALGSEDGDISLAARELRAAQEALRQALENGASEEEISRLTDQLREAMQRFFQALADQARQNPQQALIPPNANMQMLSSQDLQRMLDQIEQLARNGSREAAQQLLSQLQRMLENLQTGQQMQMSPQGNQAAQMLNELGEMIRRQQQLMDETQRHNRGQPPNGQDGRPMTPEEMAEALSRLQGEQQALQQALRDLMKQLEGMGMQPNGQLGQADRSMGEAAGELGQGQTGPAVGSQGDALQALRQGAQGMAEQMARQFGPGNQPGNGPGPFGRGLGNGDQRQAVDPLGRMRRTQGPDFGDEVKVPDEIDTQRAREILEAIRRKLGELGRPQIELDYLERLLNRY